MGKITEERWALKMQVSTKSSLAIFVYPFIFEGVSLESLRKAIEQTKVRGREGEIAIWQKASFPKDDLLSHVERYLNPPEETAPTALLWEMNGNALQSPSGLGANCDWKMSVDGKKQIAFKFKDVKLALFRIGVGFINFETCLDSNSIDDWLDFLHFFRFAGGQRGVRLKAERKTGKEQTEPFFPSIAGGTEKHPDGTGTLMDIVSPLLQALAKKEWWQEVFIPKQLIPFATIFVDKDNLTENEVAKLIYRVRNFFPSTREISPSCDDLRFDHPSLLSYADKMWFIFSHEGGAFLAFNAPQTDFFRRELPNHLRDQYFLLFLLALHQKFALMRLSQEVSEHWLKGSTFERSRVFERIRNDLLDFTARGYFTQVMQREHHYRVYRKLQEVLQIEQLYREVSDEVREMHEYLVAEQTKRLEERLNLFATFIGVPTLVFGFLSINLYGITAKEEGLPLLTAILFGVISFCAGGIIWLILRKRG